MKGYAKRFLAAVFVLAVAGPAVADPAVADEYAAVRGKIEICSGCHGDNGASTDAKYPILAGQHLYYIYVQLKDFKSGARKAEEMSAMAADLDKKEMLSVAKFFSEQKWPRIAFTADAARAAQGEAATVAGQCVQCHRGGYEGDSRIPRLAGQYPVYLKKTMMDFKHKRRMNSAAKSSLMASYREDDITAISEFLGGM